MSCSDYSDQNNCISSLTVDCNWCGSIYDGSGCCIAAGSASAGETCSCIGQPTHGNWSALHIVMVVLGVIFWLAICIAIYKCCTRRQQRIVVTRTIVVNGNGNNQQQQAVTGYANYGEQSNIQQYQQQQQTQDATPYEGKVMNPESLGYKTANDTY